MTATVAAALLCALWFVPSASATDEQGGARTGATLEAPAPGGTGPSEDGRDSTVYFLGGTALLGLGATSVTLAMRRRGRAS
nr:MULTISPECIES: hypothetical protein [unclassified Streptomyces]